MQLITKYFLQVKSTGATINLCFKHAVRRAYDDDEKIDTEVETSSYWSEYMGSTYCFDCALELPTQTSD